MASLTYSISMAAAPREGMVHGTKGNIKLHASMHALNKFTVNVTGEYTMALTLDISRNINRFKHGHVCKLAAHMQNCLGAVRAGKDGLLYLMHACHNAQPSLKDVLMLVHWSRHISQNSFSTKILPVSYSICMSGISPNILRFAQQHISSHAQTQDRICLCICPCCIRRV